MVAQAKPQGRFCRPISSHMVVPELQAWPSCVPLMESLSTGWVGSRQ